MLLKRANERMSSKAGTSPTILKQMALQGPEYQVLGRGQKRNVDDNKLESLKIMQSTIKRYLYRKLVCSRNNSIRLFSNLHKWLQQPRVEIRKKFELFTSTINP